MTVQSTSVHSITWPKLTAQASVLFSLAHRVGIPAMERYASGLRALDAPQLSLPRYDDIWHGLREERQHSICGLTWDYLPDICCKCGYVYDNQVVGGRLRKHCPHCTDGYQPLLYVPVVYHISAITGWTQELVEMLYLYWLDEHCWQFNPAQGNLTKVNYHDE